MKYICPHILETSVTVKINRNIFTPRFMDLEVEDTTNKEMFKSIRKTQREKTIRLIADLLTATVES